MWVLERAGGEARQLTQFKGGVTSYRVVARRQAPGAGASTTATRPQPTRRGERGQRAAAAKPIVIDSYQFKRDGQTYLTGKARTRVFIFDIDDAQGRC